MTDGPAPSPADRPGETRSIRTAPDRRRARVGRDPARGRPVGRPGLADPARTPDRLDHSRGSVERRGRVAGRVQSRGDRPSMRVVTIDGPAGAGKSTVVAAAGRAARLAAARHRGDVPRRHPRGAPRRGRPRQRRGPRRPRRAGRGRAPAGPGPARRRGRHGRWSAGVEVTRATGSWPTARASAAGSSAGSASSPPSTTWSPRAATRGRSSSPTPSASSS